MIPAIIIDECWLRSLFGVAAAADGGGIQSALGQHRKPVVLAKEINCPRHISTSIRRQIDWCGFI